MRSNDKVEREVAALGSLPHDKVAALWVKVHGCQPPKAIKRALLERSAAWHIQAKVSGGLSPATRKAIKSAIVRLDASKPSKQENENASGSAVFEPSGAMAGDNLAARAGHRSLGTASANDGKPVSAMKVRSASEPSAPSLQAGMRLLREWNGRQHYVDVVADGFVFDGKTYRSLSAIARHITGAHWSGPRFFGL